MGDLSISWRTAYMRVTQAGEWARCSCGAPVGPDELVLVQRVGLAGEDERILGCPTCRRR